MKILLDTVSYNSKPTERIQSINSRLNKNEVDITVEQLAEYIAKGHTFVPATFGSLVRNNTNWQQQQLFCLDFDTGITPEEVLNRLKEFHLQHSFFYSTFSDTPEHRKFRVVFHLDINITNIEIAKAIIKRLMLVFPECDRACKDPARLFFGGKYTFYHDFKPLELDLLETAARCSVVASTDTQNTARKLAELSKSEELSADCYIYKQIAVNSSKKGSKPAAVSFQEVLRGVDIKELVASVKILDSFVSGANDGYWQDGYHRLKGIVTNLQYIEGGLKWVREVMDKHGYFHKHHYALLYVVPRYKYRPMMLENFSPFKEDWEYHNILEATGVSDFNMVKLNEGKVDAYSLDDATTLLDKYFKEALNAANNSVYIIKTATGLGKTRLLETLPKGKYTIAVPTHKLKDELEKRISENKSNVNDYLVTPELPDGLPDEFTNHYRQLYALGAKDEATKLLRSFQNITDENTRLKLSRYVLDNSLVYGNTRDSILTTHKKALGYRKDRSNNLKFAFEHTDTLIMDEDILPCLIETDKVTREDLHRLDEKLPKTYKASKKLIADLIKSMEGAILIEKTPAYYIPTKQLEFIIKEVSENYTRYKSNIIGFLFSTCHALDEEESGVLHFATKHPVPNKRIIVFSATADETIYKSFFKDRKIHFIDLSNVVTQGNVHLDTKYTCSKSSLARKNKSNELYVINYVNENIPKNFTSITFQSFKLQITNADNIVHFGNCSGYDHLKGKDIAVVGCPHLPEVIYPLYAKCLGEEITTRDCIMGRHKIRRNGYEFNFMTFNNEFLQDIQLYCIESQLIQAIGRARALRTDATVLVFSGLPVRTYNDSEVNIIPIDALNLDKLKEHPVFDIEL